MTATCEPLPDVEDTAVSVAARLAEVEPMVRTICQSRLGPVDGDDAAQRALLEIWRKLTSPEPVSSLHGFAAMCARQAVYATVVKERRTPVPTGDQVGAREPDPQPGPEARALRAAEAAQAVAQVEALLAQLPARQVQVLRATKLAAREVDTATAAQELGITASSVRTVQVRAMARLRELCGTRSPNRLASPVPIKERRAARPTGHSTDPVGQAGPAPVDREAQDAFAADLKRSRDASRLSQAQLAAAVGYDESYVSKVERGKMWPSREFARRVDDVLTTDEAFQDRHSHHRGATDAETAADTAAVTEPRDQGADLDDGGVAGHVRDESPAAVACAAAHDAVQSALGHAQADEAGAIHATSAQDEDQDEQARAARLARWHADDQETAADTADEWAWSA